MRKGFTLIELMIVIAIIAIIAAIAIPNLLESRISSNEAAAASSLKSGIFPAQVTFQSGSYMDQGGPTGATPNGIGDYAKDLKYMAGFTGAAPAPSVTLSMLAPTWNFDDTVVQNSSYLYDCDSNYETGFCVTAWPVDLKDSVGRRRFAINGTGQVYATPPNSVNALVTTDTPFGLSFIASAVTGWSPYKR